MSCHLNKELKTKYDVRSIPVRKGDTVKIMRGTLKGKEGKVMTVYRKKWAIHIEKVVREKTNGKHIVSAKPLHRFSSAGPHPPIKLHCYQSQD